jgi:hypothetical protein
MTRNRKGFSPIAIILLGVAVIAAAGIGAYYYFKPAPASQQSAGNNPPTAVTSTSTVASPTSTTPVSSSTASFIMTPDNGPVGVPVTVSGSGFAATGNMVTMNGMVSGSLRNLSSNGKSITFTIPSSLGPNCQPNQACPQFMLLVTPHVYTIAVISNGVTRSVGSFTVTASGTPIGL